jgi:hypothetical protein
LMVSISTQLPVFQGIITDFSGTRADLPKSAKSAELFCEPADARSVKQPATVSERCLGAPAERSVAQGLRAPPQCHLHRAATVTSVVGGQMRTNEFTMAADLPIARLRRFVVRLAADGDADALWLAAAVRMYEEGAPQGLTLDAALGLVPRPGCRSWWRVERRDRRDILIREIADRFFPGLAKSHIASQIDQKLLRYQTTSWRFDRARRAPPAPYAGTIEAFLFAALNQPISKRVIERALGACQELPAVNGERAVRSLAAEEIENAFETKSAVAARSC